MSIKKVIKTSAIICFASALLMAGWGAYESFSQSATSHDWDWALRIYLFSASFTFGGLFFCALNRTESFKMFWFNVRWDVMYLIPCIAFCIVGATNVSDYSISPEDYDQKKVMAHMISTAIAALSSAVLAWHYFPKGSRARYMAIIPITTGLLLFGGSLISKTDWLTTAIGEAQITFFIMGVVWVIINEQIPKEIIRYFTKADLVSFGNYLGSDERKARYEAMDSEFPNGLPASERLKEVSHADIANWMDSK